MNYWRMQLHPDDGGFSSFYAHQSIVKGFIGLGFKQPVGDLLSITDKLQLGDQSSYLKFATEMKKGDRVLIISHHNPIAVVEVDGEYNYIRNTLPELGCWFNHFRRISSNVIYYSDYVTNVKKFKSITMTNAVSRLKDKDSQSYKLIDKMIEWQKKHE